MAKPSPFRAMEFLRSDPLRTTRVVPDPLLGPAGGSVLLRIERFVLSSNNVTYALLGDRLGYWAPFPAAQPGWGRVPAWGIALVLDGDPELARRGELFTGFLPMSTHVLVQAESLEGGLRATAPERAGMYPMYRDMVRSEGVMTDVELAVLPSAATAAHLADELRACGPSEIVFSSATSRTALTTAVLLRRAGIRIVGLTSAGHLDVASLAGVYDEVVPYDSVEDLASTAGTVYAEIAGRPETTRAVHAAFGAGLVRSLRIGATHATHAADGSSGDVSAWAPSSGPTIEGFAVGLRRVQVADRIGEEKAAAFEHAARSPISEWAAEHLTVERVDGLGAARQAWRRVQRGEVPSLTTIVVVP